MATKLNTWNWQNEVLLTHAEYPFALAVHASLVRDVGLDASHALEVGPALQTDGSTPTSSSSAPVAR
jgi:hypothetical protein